MKESPPPEPHPMPVAVAPMPLAIAPTQMPINKPNMGMGNMGNMGNMGMVGTPTYHHTHPHPGGVAPAPGPSPHFQMQHFQPRPVPQPSPHQAQPHHLQPQPQQQPMAMHVPHPGMQVPQMQPSPHYPPQAYPPQYGVQGQMAPQPMQYSTPTHIAPAFDQHHRPVHPAPAAMTPSRAPMAPTPNSMVSHSQQHTNPNPNAHIYNVPRAPEVYTLAEAVDAAIPPDVRERYQCDEQGRVLFFTAPPLQRPSNGVAEQYAGLGHSVRHLASIKQLREERARKRKARDDAAALEQLASKKLAALQERDARQRAEDEEHAKAQLLEQALLGLAAEIDAGTEVLDERFGGFENWRRMREEEREAGKGLTDEEKRVRNLQWFCEEQVKRGTMTEAEKRDFEEVFVRRKFFKE